MGTKKKDASMNSLLNAATAAQEQLLVQADIQVKMSDVAAIEPEKKGRGRPKKTAAKRQQLPVYLPEIVYFEMLDYVNLKKRSDRQYSLNDLMLEGLDLWLSSLGKPSIQQLIDSEK